MPLGCAAVPFVLEAGVSSRRRNHPPHRGWTEAGAVSWISERSMGRVLRQAG